MQREPENCTHICTEESGCIIRTLNCLHEHDEDCTFSLETAAPAEGTEGDSTIQTATDSNGYYEIGTPEDDVAAVQALIDALPTAAFAAANEYTADGIKYTLSSEGGTNTATVSDCITTLSGDVTIPANVTVNGAEYAVTSIGNQAFYGSLLTSITIPKGVTSIGDEAFKWSHLTSITIPEGVTSIGEKAFYEAPLTSITIPKGVTSIAKEAFYGTRLTSIIIPDSVTSIGEKAFLGTQLTSIIIPEGVTSIGMKAFAESDLTSITIPDSVTSIGMEAFSGTRLTSITIPKGVTTIDGSAFYACVKLGEITVADENSSYVVDDGVLFNKDRTTLVCYPMAKSGDQYTIPDSVKTIGTYAFTFCTMTSITIPEGVETIDNYAFMGCTGWTDITIPGSVKTIGRYAFAYCTMTSITIPEGVTSIGECAFNSCKNLTSIIIPGSVKTIGGNVFYNCSKFETVYYVGDESSWSRITIDSTNNISDKVVYCHAVTLDLNGGTGVTSGAISSKDAKVLAADPTRSGYTFAGWYTEKDGSEEVSLENYSSCSTIYAGWRKNIGGSDVLSDITITCESSTLIYNAKAQSPTVTVKDGENTLTLDTDYTLSGNTGTDAKTYTLTITGKGNYAGTVTKDWSIAPKEISVTGATAVNRPYEKDDTTVEISGVTFEGATLTKGTDYTATGTVADADAGDSKEVSVTVELKDTAAARNYTLNGSTTTTTVKIEKTSYAGTTTATGSAKYGSSNSVDLSGLIMPGGTATASIKTDTDKVLNGTPTMDGNKLQFTLANDATLVGKTADIEVSVSGCTNYENYKITVTLTVDDKLTPTVTAPTAKTLTYNGTMQTLITAGSTNGGTLQYSLDNSTWSAALPKAKDADNYTIYYKVVGNADYADTAVNSIPVTIGKKTVTVKPKSYTITQGNTIPAFALEYDGLVDGDTLHITDTPAFTCYEADGNTAVSTSTAAGSYTITWTNSDAFDFTNETNYTVTKATTGTLTINAKPNSNNGSSDSGNDHVTYYTLTFETNGGSSIKTVRTAYGKTIDLSGYAPTRSGYDFSGWYSDKGLTNKVTKIKLTGNKTVYAGWVKHNPNTGAGNPFTDVSQNDWFYEHVMFVYGNNLMTGTSATTFEPNSSTTRAQIAVIFYRMEGSPAVEGKNNYTDVEYGPGTAWYYNAATWAQQSGIIGGYGDGKFGPNDPVTREQLAAIFYRYAQYKGYDTAQGGMAIREFDDYENISPYAMDAMTWAVNIGIMNGKGNNRLDPQGTATRAEIAAMLHRFIEKYSLTPAPVAPTTGSGGNSGGMSGWVQQIGSPKTGDNTNMGLWLFTLCASAGAMTVLLFLKRREEEEHMITA